MEGLGALKPYSSHKACILISVAMESFLPESTRRLGLGA